MNFPDGLRCDRVPEVGRPWPEGRAVVPAHVAPWLVLRHGGRCTDSWKQVGCADDEQEACDRFKAVEAAMRRGGVVLVDPDGVVRGRAWAPRLRTRW
jgi:hypothetical protein